MSTKFIHLQQSDNILITNLQRLMGSKSISEAVMSRETDIPQPTLHKILSGKTTDPRISTLKMLAKYFNTTVENLYDEQLCVEAREISKTMPIPILSWQTCSNLHTHQKSTTAHYYYWVNKNHKKKERLFALTSKPSMAPCFRPGSILIIDTQMHPHDGDYVVALYPNTQEATLRVWHTDGPEKKLCQIQQQNICDPFNDEYRIIGTLIESHFQHQSKESL